MNVVLDSSAFLNHIEYDSSLNRSLLVFVLFSYFLPVSLIVYFWSLICMLPTCANLKIQNDPFDMCLLLFRRSSYFFTG